MTGLPQVPLPRVLARVASVWHPAQAPIVLAYATTGGGKSTLVKQLLSRRPVERVLLVEPKRNADPVYEGPPEDPLRWGRPVSRIAPMFGYDGEPGGGPDRMWFRLQGGTDRADTARNIGDALEIVANEGLTYLIFDDVKEICRQLGLRADVESILNLGRSAGVCAVLATTETSWVTGREQSAMTFVGYTGGSLPAARAGAELLGWRGRELQDACARVGRHEWIYQDHEAGNAGPCLVTSPG